MFCWREDREGTDKKASRGGMWPCPQALGFGELSIIALTQASKTCNSRHPHVEALSPMLGDTEASLHCKCLPWFSKGIQGWGKGQPPTPTAFTEHRGGGFHQVGEPIKVSVSWRWEKLPSLKPSTSTPIPPAPHTQTPQTLLPRGEARRMGQAQVQPYLLGKDSALGSVRTRTGEPTVMGSLGNLIFAWPFTQLVLPESPPLPLHLGLFVCKIRQHP